MKKIIAVVMSLVMAFTLASCGLDGTTEDDGTKVYKIVYAGTVAETNPMMRVAVQIADEMREASNGRLDMTVYASNQLGDTRSNIEQMQLGLDGIIHVGEMSTGPLGNFTDLFVAMNLPFMFDSFEQAFNFVDESEYIQNAIEECAEEVGVRPVAWLSNSARMFTNNKHEVRTPADMKGLKIRVMENPIFIKAFEAMGASALPMSLAEVFTALQQGTIDGQDNPLAITVSNKFYEVQSYYTDLSHNIDMCPVVVNEEWYQSLPDDLRAIFDEYMQEYAERERELILAEDEDCLKEVATTCEITTLTDDERAAFKEACEPVYDWFRTTYPDVDLDEFINAVAEY